MRTNEKLRPGNESGESSGIAREEFQKEKHACHAGLPLACGVHLIYMLHCLPVPRCSMGTEMTLDQQWNEKLDHLFTRTLRMSPLY